MWFFGKKKKNDTTKILDNKHFIEDMTGSVDVLLAMGRENDELTEILTDIQDKIKYLNPSLSEEVTALDSQISDKLNLMKSEVSKAKQTGNFKIVIDMALDLRDGLLVERASKR